MKKCISCGTQLPDEASFCMHCMTPLSPVTEVVNMPIKRPERNVLVGLLTALSLATAVGVAVLLGRFSALQTLALSLNRAK